MIVAIYEPAGQAGTNGAQPGANGTAGGSGPPAVATANAAADTDNEATAYGGPGGGGGSGANGNPPDGSTDSAGAAAAGGGGGGATASATTTAAGASSKAVADANAGSGGGGGQPGVPSEPTGGDTALGAPGGSGANATATATDTNSAGSAYASALAQGGTGGSATSDSSYDGPAAGYVGNLNDGGAAGTASATASAIGTTAATAIVSESGGSGGSGPGPSAGASASLNDAATGYSNRGSLELEQTAMGGAGGTVGGDYEHDFLLFNNGAAGGKASATETLDDTAAPTQSNTVTTVTTATGGAGGGGSSDGGVGGDAAATANVTGAHDLTVTVNATGGLGGPGGDDPNVNGESDIADQFLSGYGGNGGAASASGIATTTSLTGSATVDVNVTGGGAGGAFGPYGGQTGATTLGTVAAYGGRAASATADVTGGAGGSESGTGGSGAAVTLDDAVAGTTHGGALTLVQDAQGGNGGGGGTGGGGVTSIGGTGGAASSTLDFDETQASLQSTTITGTAAATGGHGGTQTGFLVTGTPGGGAIDGGTGGNASSSIVLTAPDMVGGTPTNVTVTGDSTGGTGLTGGSATAKAQGTGHVVTVNANAVGGAAETTAGTAQATAIGTGSSGTVAATSQDETYVFIPNPVNPYFVGTSRFDSVTTSASIAVAGATTSAMTLAGIGSAAPALDTTDEAVATGVILPTSLFGGGQLTAGETPLLAVELGGGTPAGSSGELTAQVSENFTIDVSQFASTADVSLDLGQGTLVGTGVGTVSFSLTAGSKVVSETFATGAAAQAYFDGQVIDLGALGTLEQNDTAVNDPSVLEIQVSLSVDPTTSQSGFFVNLATGVACYMRGTRLLTDTGEVPVEMLTVGDRVITLSGKSKPIEWIGRRTMDCSRHPHPETVWPVCIQAHAFGEGTPNRDLFLSPDHAVYLQDVLIPVRSLQNGGTVRQRPVGSVMYYHVELEEHDVVLAEGLAVETFLDAGNRTAFANDGDGPVQLYPGFAPLGNDTWDSRSYAPLVAVGAPVERALEQLRAREGVLGARAEVARFADDTAA